MKFEVQVLVIGKNIRAYRKAKGMSQVDLSVLTDIEQANLANLENGRANPTIKTLCKISDALGVSLKDLLS